ncbi:MAG: NAD-dependent epimerase/dehydratase family protein [Bacteroidetes bacterium]|nr:NAD-dependent epimerase/dehydratase family protein [Bacteroidota bacterium]
MSKIIVTGGAGFIGSHIVDALIDSGHEVHIVDDMSAGKHENVNEKAILHIIDIRDKEKLLPIFAGVDYVFHEAAVPRVQYSIDNPAETHDINVNGLLNVLEACRVNKVKRLIFASSSSIYGEPDILPTSEDIPINPMSPYASHKYIGEVYLKLYAKIYGLETVNLRYFNVYGPRFDPNGAYPLVIGYFLKRMQESKTLTITGDGTQTRDFVHVHDVAEANLLAMKGDKVGKGEVINIGGGKRYSMNYIAGLIGGEVEYISPRLEPHDTEADISKAKELLGWTPKIKLEDGIKELLK